MTDSESRDLIIQVHSAVFGVSGRGGALERIEKMSTRLKTVEKKVNTISGKWLTFMTILAIVGQMILPLVVSALTHALHLG